MDARAAGVAVVELIKRGIRPSDIMTREAFENAIAVVIALGGSTNAVLHLLAMAHAANVKLELDDFTKIGKKVPVLADLKPSGKFHDERTGEDRRPDAADAHAARGRPAARRLHDRHRQDDEGEPEAGETIPERPGDRAAAQQSASRRTATS